MEERKPYSPTILHSIAAVRRWRLTKTLEGKTVGFIPTMGALHQGHFHLVKQSLAANDATIVSIFVNPSQFAPTEDLDQYPRTTKLDIEQLAALEGQHEGLCTKVDAVFLPQVEEMYPLGIELDVQKQSGAFVSVLGLSEMLEGRTRPNFFRGVATVVTKLFILVNPTRAYFGQKDYQQSLVVKQLVKDLLFDIEIVVCDIWRDSDGLALSSRNKYLDCATLEKLKQINKMLQKGKEMYEEGETNTQVLLQAMKGDLEKYVLEGSMLIDYVSINDKETLEELETITDKGAVFSCAIYVKNEDGRETRLIDNVLV